MTRPSARRAMIGSTRPNSWMLRVSASISASEMRRGLPLSGRTLPMGTCSMLIAGVLATIEPPIELVVLVAQLWRQVQPRPAGRRHPELAGEGEHRPHGRVRHAGL